MTSKNEAIEYALRAASENDVKFIRLWFTDILGNIKGFAITAEELENSLTRGMGFDGSSIAGYARVDERDLYVLPDPTTFTILPWRPKSNAVARMFCDIITPDEKPFEGDSRNVLRTNIKAASDKGFTYYVAPELEYFYFKSSTNPEPLDNGGYFDQITPDIATDLRRDTVLMLEELGIPVESSHHEAAPSQHEIDLRHTDAFTMADTVITYKSVVKEIAMANGYYASFMPKPIMGVNGNGMHTHMSLFKGDINAFLDQNEPYKLSSIGRQFCAGLLKHAKEITLVTNQWVNSYKRLVPSYEAPTHVSWAEVNRSDLIRIPSFKPDRGDSRRIEYRAPDPSCNPYLAFSVMLAAGLNGIDNKLELSESSSNRSSEMSEKEKKSLGIESLPRNLGEAIQLTENSALVRDSLGDTVFESFIENKKIEWEAYCSQISQYELEKYLPNL
jgi:glutamine synthetase